MFIELPITARAKALRKPLYGRGINDAAYMTSMTVHNKQIRCPYYAAWLKMFTRCYSKSSLTQHPSYIGCSVSKEWYVFSVFRQWMQIQNWEGNALDKDILKVGNKLYSPATCCFVPSAINTLISKTTKTKGPYPIGVTLNKSTGKYISSLSIQGKTQHLGTFTSADDAHTKYVESRKEYIKQIASTLPIHIKKGLHIHADNLV